MQLKAWAVFALSALPTVYARQHLNSRVINSVRRHDGRGQQEAPPNGSSTYQTRFPGVTWDDDNWMLTTTSLDQGHYQSRGSVANGYLGISVSSVGPFFELDVPVEDDVLNGWPLDSRRQSFATIAGFWDSQPTTSRSNFEWLSQYGTDSVISGVPHWSGLVLDLGNGVYLDSTVDNKTITEFQSTYDFKSGILSWSYTWTPKGDLGSYAVTYRLLAHKLKVNQAVVDLQIVPSANGKATVVNVIDGYSAVRTDFVESGEDEGAIFSAVRPWGVPDVAAYLYANLTGSDTVDLCSRRLVKDKPYIHANQSSLGQAVDVEFLAHQPVRITKFVGGASSDAFPDPRQTAKQAASSALAAGYDQLLHTHASEWASVMPDTSVDRFTDPITKRLPSDLHVIDSAIIAVANTYYLVQNTVGKNAIKAVGGAPVNVDSISVGGLTSDSYAGQVFWDADVWMQPGLVASHPEAAQRITNYRVKQHQQAVRNAQTAYVGSKNETVIDKSAAIYPWTSARFGNCTATGPCWDYQYHLNGDIGLSLIYQWVTSGDTQTFREKHFPVYDSIATLFSNIVQRNGSSWTLTNMTDPDEFADHVDGGGYTLPLIGETLTYANQFRQQFDIQLNDQWTDIAENVMVLRENGITLEYTTMNGSTRVKQADVVLLTYPLDYDSNYTSKNALTDLDYYANKQSPDGPAMTWAIFSIVANAMSPSGCSAHTYHQVSFAPYARPPFYQLSEQMVDRFSINGGTHPAFPFLTGHGGSNQIVLFGYLGLRLLPDNVLHVDPNLPPQIPHLRYRTFYWRGWPIAAESNYTHTTLQRDRSAPALSTADPRWAQNAPITVEVGASPGHTTRYSLPKNGTLTIANRRISDIKTTPGNLVQCAAVYSPDPFEPGQLPMGAVDGATSTKWQPSTAANWTSLTVTLPPPMDNNSAVITGFDFTWGSEPPVNATIILHDTAPSHSSSTPSKAPPTGRTVCTLTNIKQSAPYDAKKTDLNAVVIPLGNTTHVDLNRSEKPARYATLYIVGNQASGGANNGTGATVAEWVILGGRAGGSRI
ncbi:alpha,alpha-trehalase treA [Aspergillus candidus]|uniref:alpha,alpha-trehalase n=1 Tax=Aspergillus candidus TaxID=41067 RepID=A0A2I2FDD4_ASPCN|nr:alpha,alpha-trehalose glucohydrolase TreA/Ath1 [Aspergillus candidus]PLB38653.1 alpha,alpha-trehalose glucohydrolase TreA/Ath1 [Aspergillus candidus]